MLGRTWYFYILEYRNLFHIIFIHPLNKGSLSDDEEYAVRSFLSFMAMYEA